MENILLFDNKMGYLAAVSSIENNAMSLVQNVVDEFGKLGIEKLQPSDFLTLFRNPVDLIYDKMTGGATHIGELKVHKKKAIDILQKPAGYTTFLQKLDDMMILLKDKLLPPFNHPITAINLGTYFELEQDLKVVFKEEMKGKIKAGFQKYAKSDKAKNILAFANDIIASYEKNGIKSIAGSDGNGLPGLIKNIIVSKFGQGISLNIDEILKYN